MPSLHPSASNIAAEHADLISGMEALYQTLIDQSYIQNTDVQVPPHGLPKDPIAVASLRAAGLAPETIELIGRLPWFTNDIIDLQRASSNSRDGIAIAPFSSAASYLLGSGRHDDARGVGIGPVGGDELIPTTAFKLATTSSSEGYNFAYDLDDKTIIKWHPDAWGKCQRVPVTAFFDDCLRRLRTLEWLPWRNDSGWEVEAKQANCHADLEDPHSAHFREFSNLLERERVEAEARRVQPMSTRTIVEDYLIVQKAAHNRYWAKRLIYEKCGWPDSFDHHRFEERQQEWNARAKELGASASSKSQAAQDASEAHLALWDFYKSTAGSSAI